MAAPFVRQTLGSYEATAVISAERGTRVLLASHVSTGDVVALKCFERAEIRSMERIKREIDASAKAVHPHIIRFIEVHLIFILVCVCVCVCVCA